MAAGSYWEKTSRAFSGKAKASRAVTTGPMTRATKKATAKIANRRGAEGPKKSMPAKKAAAKAPSGRNGGTGVNRQASSSASGVYKKKLGR